MILPKHIPLTGESLCCFRVLTGIESGAFPWPVTKFPNDPLLPNKLRLPIRTATLTGRSELTAEETCMAKCENWGNEYDKSFEIIVGGKRHTFDSFECAIHKLAPKCTLCGCRILGHGIEQEGQIFCCAHCAREYGATELDRA
jgi:hypothetical protein